MVEKMRLVRIPNLEYEDYERLRDAMFDVIPFAIICPEYSKKLKTGFFNFWDSDYIPDELQKFIVQPPLSRENKDKMKASIVAALKPAQKILTTEDALRIKEKADTGLKRVDK
jgi:hypothetical protein